MKTILVALLLVPLAVSACADKPEAPPAADLLVVLNEALRIESTFPRQSGPDGSAIAPAVVSIAPAGTIAEGWVVTFEGAWLDNLPVPPEPGVIYHQLEVVVNIATGSLDSFSASR